MREMSDYSDACRWREGGAATPLHREGEGAVDADAREPQSPADIGLQATLVLLEEIKQGGVVDYTHQVLSISSSKCSISLKLQPLFLAANRFHSTQSCFSAEISVGCQLINSYRSTFDLLRLLRR
ncbi:hypothetical protein MPTK1_8g11260 [Marchantia polymorpha subsp. ruderalis]|uniref:Uncharacterized protein n=1 Tax=Marchantia polymorpha TaxID=3197 RepID=A0A2R6XMJ4_MARPO|nr:hypothetical protein MARPO_0008s0094 [Marchantia polymorpha]BBN19506.1 hypothetical protein Mp_8g11260 [Marchantia polymorpha subsp. ruderalis]|eukprot:PTQ47322.1 hypothetical protein MARPO_0008s0094 [Marchantia polymorpha]